MLPMVQPEPVLFNCGVHSVNVAASPPATLPPSITPESDVDALVDIFFDVDVAVNAVSRIESCDLQLGDTWRGMQGKMSVTTPGKKIRKKTDNKPQQAQINKCNNEKRRRELENETINQLEELLGTCLAEVKQPDKNGIVREATRQIQDVLRRRRECPDECPLRVVQQCLSPVQAGEVSSTQSSCTGLHYSELTSLIEALKHYTGTLGWVLLELNSKAEIECITENIKELTVHDRTELYKKSIFSIVHVKDHAKLRPLLRNIHTTNWGAGEVDKFQAITARLIVKNTNGTDSAGYLECVIHAAAVRGSSSEEAGSVMCVIRRCEDASAALIPGDGGPPAITAKQSDHIVFRLDCNFIILFCDLSGVENIINTTIPLIGTRYLELVESSDRIRVAAHLQEAVCLPAPPAISEPFRLRIAPDRPYFKVIARSRLFRAKPSSGEPDFIMSTHTVLGDEMEMLEPEGPRPPVGGPLMTSVANGESSNCDARYRPSISPTDAPFLNDFDLEPWASSLLGDMGGDDTKERKDAAAEGPSQPLTPRAPPTPGEGPPSNASAEEPNRLRTLLSKKPGQADQAPNSNNRILKDLLKQEDEEATGSETSAPHTPHTPGALSPLQQAQHARPALSHAQHPQHPPGTSHAHQPSHNNSDVLLRILNDKSDEDADENRRSTGDGARGTSQPSVLSQLLSNSNGPSSGHGRPNESGDNSYLDRMVGVKRKFEEAKAAASNAKRSTPEHQQVSSSALPMVTSAASPTVHSPATSGAGMSQLCQKNKILVSLLARQQTTPTTPLPLPNPQLRAYGPAQHPRPPPPRHHHSTLSNILTSPNPGGNAVNGASASSNTEGAGGLQSAQSHLHMVLTGAGMPRYAPPVSAPVHYANTAPMQYSAQPPSGTTRAQGSGDSEMPSDQTLSDILDEVINNMPDADRTAADVNLRQRQGTKEKDARINAIRQSLMQCETARATPAAGGAAYGSPGVSGAGAGAAGVGPGAAASGPASPAPRSPDRWRALQAACSPAPPGPAAPAALSPAPHYADATRARAALAEQQRARLLGQQRLQQMLVPPEAAEQSQNDLSSTMNALVSQTPPNVALTRTADYHHLYHSSSQMGANYGTNKITTTQQNPMLSRQLSVPGSGSYSHGGAHSAAALHTPMTPQPYHRAPRPHLVAGYSYEEVGAAGYCGEFARCGPPHAPPPHAPPPPPHAPAHAPLDHRGACGGAGGGTSEYVRNELRAVVGARSARPDLHTLQPPDMDLMTFDIGPPEYYGGGLGGPGPR